VSKTAKNGYFLKMTCRNTPVINSHNKRTVFANGQIFTKIFSEIQRKTASAEKAGQKVLIARPKAIGGDYWQWQLKLRLNRQEVTNAARETFRQGRKLRMIPIDCRDPPAFRCRTMSGIGLKTDPGLAEFPGERA
jgi:hypothetical protein